MFSKFTFGGLCLIQFESSVQCIVCDEVKYLHGLGQKRTGGEYTNRGVLDVFRTETGKLKVRYDRFD